MALEALGVASSVIAVVEISGRVAALCFQYSKGVKNAKEEVNRLLREVNCLGKTTSGVQDLLESPTGTKLKTSKKLLIAVEEAQAHLKKLDGDLRPSSTKKAFRRLGIGALKWPLKSKDVEKAVQQLGRCGQNISLAMQVDQTSILLDIDQKTVLSRLPIAAGATFDSFHEEGNPICLENTRVSLLDLVTQWADDPYSESLLWLNGMAGTGKSTIARTVARRLAQTGHLGASFFFKRGEADRDSFHKLFTTIAAQLATRVPGTATHIKEAIDTDPAIFQKAMTEQFNKLIVQPLSKIDPSLRKLPTLVILIDALDECGASPADIRRAIHLLSRTNDVKTPRIQIFITSRPELPIRIGFGMANTLYKSVALQEVPEYVIQHDISIFLEYQLTKIRTEYNVTVSEDRRLPLTWPGHETVQTLVKMATPLFIFASTICRYLADLRWHPDDQLAKVLRYQTKTQQSKLDATYRPVLDPLLEGLDKVEKDEILEQFRAIVGSIVSLARPLSIPSLAKLLTIPKRTIENLLGGLYSVLSVPKLPDAPVRLLHLSFRDFLLDPNKEDDNPFWVNEEQTHVTMATNCFRLMNDALRADICNLKDPGILQASIDPDKINECLPDDVQYACVNWVLHLQLSKSTIRDNDQTHEFLKRHFLNWMEALSLIGRAREAITMMKTLKQLLDNNNSRNISEFLEDATRILFANISNICDTPLQLHSSAILFAPENSVVKKIHSERLPNWISLAPVCESDWDECILQLEGHTQTIFCTAFSKTAPILASSAADNTIRIWDIQTGKCMQLLEEPANAKYIVFSKDSKLIASLSDDGSIRIWDLDVEECVDLYKVHKAKATSVSLSHDSKTLVTAWNDHKIRIWDREEGECVKLLGDGYEDAQTVLYSHDSAMVLSLLSSGTVQIWDSQTGGLRHELGAHGSSVTCVAFSHNSKMVACGSRNYKIELWCLSSGECVRVIHGVGSTHSLAFSHDSTRLASSRSHEIQIWIVSTGECMAKFDSKAWGTRSVDFSFDSNLVTCAGNYADAVRLWKVERTKATQEVVQDSINALHISPDSNSIVSASFDPTSRIWSTETGRLLHTIDCHIDMVVDVIFWPKSDMFACSSDRDAWIWNTSTGECLKHFTGQPSRILALSLSSSFKLLATASKKMVCVWDSVTGELILEKPTGGENANSLDISSDDTILVLAVDRSVKSWHIPSGEQRDTLGNFSRDVYNVSFSQDSKLLAILSSRSVWIWDVEKSTYVQELEGPPLQMRRVAFSHDSKLISATSGDMVLHIWDVASGECVRTAEIAAPSARLLFDEGDQHVVTSYGSVSVTDFSVTVSGIGFSTDQSWITWNDNKVLWLPKRYRPKCSVVTGSTVSIGCDSAKVIFLRLDPQKLAALTRQKW